MSWEIVVLAVVESFEIEINPNTSDQKEMNNNNNFQPNEFGQNQNQEVILRKLGLGRLICKERGCNFKKLNNGRKAQSVLFSLNL